MAYKDIEKKRACDRKVQKKRRESRTEEQIERDRQYQKEYRERNKEKLAEQQKIYYQQNKERLDAQKKNHYIKNREHYNRVAYERIKTIKHTPQFKEQRRKYEKTYRLKHKDKIRNSENNRRKNDDIFRLIKLLRSRTRYAIRKHSLNKSSSTLEMLGCDIKTLFEWLQWSGETYDPNFNIRNYNGKDYHIDHIKTFEDVQKGIYTLEEVCHYTNLQILPAEINLSKGGTSWIE